MFISLSALSALVALIVAISITYTAKKWRYLGIGVGVLGLVVTGIIGWYERDQSKKSELLWENRYHEQKEKADRLDATLNALPRMEQAMEQRFAAQEDSEEELIGSSEEIDARVANLQSRNDVLLTENSALRGQVGQLRGQISGLRRQFALLAQQQETEFQAQNVERQRRIRAERDAEMQRQNCSMYRQSGFDQRTLGLLGC